MTDGHFRYLRRETPDAHDVPQHLKPIVTATNNIEGQQEHEIVADLTPLPNEPVLNKPPWVLFVPPKSTRCCVPPVWTRSSALVFRQIIVSV